MHPDVKDMVSNAKRISGEDGVGETLLTVDFETFAAHLFESGLCLEYQNRGLDNSLRSSGVVICLTLYLISEPNCVKDESFA